MEAEGSSSFAGCSYAHLRGGQWRSGACTLIFFFPILVKHLAERIFLLDAMHYSLIRGKHQPPIFNLTPYYPEANLICIDSDTLRFCI